MGETLQIAIVTALALGAAAILARPLWRRQVTQPPQKTPGCDKCGHGH